MLVRTKKGGYDISGEKPGKQWQGCRTVGQVSKTFERAGGRVEEGKASFTTYWNRKKRGMWSRGQAVSCLRSGLREVAVS